MIEQDALLDLVPEVTHHMALLPLAFLGILTAAGLKRDPAWWWLAGAFAVSWLADSAAHVADPWIVSLVYPVTQAALVGAVLLERREAWWMLAGLVIVGLGASWFQHSGPDVLLRTAAWGTVAGIAWQRPELGRLRTALLVYFGGGLLAWWGYVNEPGTTTWLAYQGVRATGLGLFCWAAWQGTTTLRLAR